MSRFLKSQRGTSSLTDGLDRITMVNVSMNPYADVQNRARSLALGLARVSQMQTVAEVF